jgi:hypothetical protein
MRASAYLVLMAVMASCQPAPQDDDGVPAVPAESRSENVLRYDSPVTLLGTIDTLMRFGPPNYGEQPLVDVAVVVPVLRLKVPIDVPGDSASGLNQQTEQNVSLVQLVLPPGDSLDCIEHLGQSATVRGSLLHSHTGHHYAPILVLVEKVDLDAPPISSP